MERALVTGCNGFVGRALVGRLASAAYEVWGVDRSDSDAGAGLAKHLRASTRAA